MRLKIPTLPRTPPAARDSRGAKIGSIAGGLLASVAALGAGALLAEWLRERGTREPAFDTLREDGAISLRRYHPLIVATAEANGSMQDALDTGYRRLSAYLTGKARPSGDDTRIAMSVPVIAAPSDHPGGWLIRFVMPIGKPIQALPQPGAGVQIDEVPERLIAAIRFPGRITDPAVAHGERDALRSWIAGQGLTEQSAPEFAAYNSPIIPGALRRNEWWIEVSPAAR